MNAERYSYYADALFFDFEFESLGHKGIIRKIARFQLIRENLYAFGFGDLDERNGDIRDTVVSNNGDGPKVLATVAHIIYDFTLVFQEASIFVKGSTPARTRWYQMNIGSYWEEISKTFKVYGSQQGKWQPFRKNVTYEAFLGHRW